MTNHSCGLQTLAATMAAGWRDISRLSYFLRATPRRRRKKWEARGKAASGHCCRLVIAVLKINFRDNASAAGAGLPAVGESEMKSLFRAFPDVASAPPFNLASERRNDRRSGYRRSNQSPVSSRYSQRALLCERDLQKAANDCKGALSPWFVNPRVGQRTFRLLTD